jgi:hypothetical protein
MLRANRRFPAQLVSSGNGRLDTIEDEWLFRCMERHLHRQRTTTKIHILGTVPHSPRSISHLEYALTRIKPDRVGVWYTNEQIAWFHHVLGPFYADGCWKSGRRVQMKAHKERNVLERHRCDKLNLFAMLSMGLPAMADLLTVQQWFNLQNPHLLRSVDDGSVDGWSEMLESSGGFWFILRMFIFFL